MRLSSGRSFGKRSLALGAVLALAAVMAAALGGGAGAATQAKPVSIALFVAIQSNPVEQSIINNFKAVAKKDGAAKFTVFDSNNSVQKEIANCKDAIASGRYDAFALKAVAGPPLMNCARDALKAGIPVVVFGNALGPNPNTAKRQIPGLSASVIELARANGIAVADLTNRACKAAKANPCNVIYTYGPLAFDWASLSRKFFTQTVKAKYPSIKVVATGLNNFDPDTARTLTKSLLQTKSDVHVIASDGDLGAFGVIAAIKDLGKKPGKDILVTGGALSKQGAALIRNGQLYGSTCLMPATEARVSAQLSIRAARGLAIAQTDVEVCAVYSRAGMILTKQNIGKFTPEW